MNFKPHPSGLAVPEPHVSTSQAGGLKLPEKKRFDVAVFPLVNEVLFPGVSLPIQIFEARYDRMLQDVQARGWPLAVSLVVPHSRTEFVLNTICGAGPIQVSKSYEDGRSDILVHGKQRVKLRSFLQKEPYFVMEAESLDVEECSISSSSQMASEQRALQGFLALMKTWAFVNAEVPREIGIAFESFGTMGELSDFFVFHFIKKAQDKQVYLNCTDPTERAEMLARYLETDLIRLTKKISKNQRAMLLH